MTATARLVAALDDSLRHDAEYGQRLSNHLPMLLVALHRLGAVPAMIRKPATRGWLPKISPGRPPTATRYTASVPSGAARPTESSVKSQRGSQRGSQRSGTRCEPAKTSNSSSDTNSVRPSNTAKGVVKIGLSITAAVTAKPTDTPRLPQLSAVSTRRARPCAGAAGAGLMLRTIAPPLRRP